MALPTILKITEPTEQEALGEFASEEEDRPGAMRKTEASAHHAQLLREKLGQT